MAAIRKETRAVKPNRNLKDLLEKNDAFHAKFKQAIHGGRMMQFMNAWADVYADDPKAAGEVMERITRERGIAATI